jgi:glycosyltransferase involved in cell wall biosynthesis
MVRLQERLSCVLADHLLTASTGFEERLIARGNPPEKITLLYNAADPLVFRYDAERRFEPCTDQLRLIYHGTLAHRYGLHVLIEALPRVRARYRAVHLDLYGAGDPDYERLLRERVTALGLGDCVAFRGWRPVPELPACFREADIAVVPYLNDEFMDLAISSKSFEYAVSGLPMVATRLRPMVTLFDDDCITYVSPGSSAEIADGILALAASPERRARQSRLAHAAQARFSGEAMAERYTGLVQDLIARGSMLSPRQPA